MQVALFSNKSNAALGGKSGIGLCANSVNYLFRETPSCHHHTWVQAAVMHGSMGDFVGIQSAFTEWIDIPKEQDLAARWLTNLAPKKNEGKFNVQLKLEITSGLCVAVCFAGIKITLYRDEKSQGEILADRSSIKTKGFLTGDTTLMGKVAYYEICNINPHDNLGNFIQTCDKKVWQHR